MATIGTESVSADSVGLEPALSLVTQFRHFLWLSSGMFSMSAFALAFLEFWAAGPVEQGTTHFLAAIASAALFGVATFLKLGPDEA